MNNLFFARSINSIPKGVVETTFKEDKGSLSLSIQIEDIIINTFIVQFDENQVGLTRSCINSVFDFEAFISQWNNPKILIHRQIIGERIPLLGEAVVNTAKKIVQDGQLRFDYIGSNWVIDYPFILKDTESMIINSIELSSLYLKILKGLLTENFPFITIDYNTNSSLLNSQTISYFISKIDSIWGQNIHFRKKQL